MFSPGGPATGDLAALVTLINQEGAFGRDQQEAIWQVTDGYDLSQNPEAEALVQAAAQGAATDAPVAGVDDDPENLLAGCAGNRTGFGDPTEDRSRCVTFRYEVPEGGVESAVVYLSIEAPTGSLQDTDSVGIAVGAPFPEQCDLAGDMPGCVRVHGGFAGGSAASPPTCSTWPATRATRGPRRCRTRCGPNCRRGCFTSCCRTTRPSSPPAWH